MNIDIHLPRPGVTLLAITAASGWAMYWNTGMQAQTAGNIEATPVQTLASVMQERLHENIPAAATVRDETEEDGDSRLTQMEMRIKWARMEQEFLRVKQDIIREQLAGLQKERDAMGPTVDPATEEQFRRSVQLLTSLVKDQQKAEQFLRASYRQQWESEESAMVAASSKSSGAVTLFWPVEPKLGVSAYFLDEAYEQRFKVRHYAIDIPEEQGTDLLAAQDGIVKNVVDHGLGYNYITIDHGGYATVYGHVSEFSVRPGQRVRAGDVIGKSGGMPGLRGGGSSTGPHLHFGLYVNGVPVDPLQYLPKLSA